METGNLPAIDSTVKNIITHNGKYSFTYEDYKYFVRTIYAEAGGSTGSNIAMKMAAATIINIMEQDKDSGAGSIITVLNRTCTATKNLKSFEESKLAEPAVKAVLAGNDPTNGILNGFGKKGAVAFSSRGNLISKPDETTKVYKDSKGNVICIKNKNMYFKSKWNLDISKY